MTVKELKNILDGLDQDMEVYYQYPSGDYWRSKIAAEISRADQTEIEYSEYHQKMTVCGEIEDDNETKTVIVLQ